MAKRARRKTTPSRPPARRPRGSGARDGASAAPTRFEISAGGVIYRHTADGIAICLISTKGGARWQLPKGKREPGESLEQTAAREVAEETGLVGEVGSRLDRIDLWFTWNEDGTPIRHHKLVYFYLLRYRHGSTADHDHEVDEARWFPAEEAIARLTFPNEQRVVARALELLAAGPEPAGDPARAP